jgi:N-acetylmuramoyl-L-alanine amidase
MIPRLRLTVVALSALATACGGPPPTKINRLYQGLADPLPRIDPSILAGRRVLVDPGHGGHFRGTVGQDSLEESRVNLGVGLYLWGLLREAGANVWLTRSVDRDFLGPEDSTLAADLRARVAMADTLHPDVFVSIHHNAQPRRDPDYNRVETYYKAGDPASLDLAFAVHRHLMRNLGIETGEVRQGNYFVLRNSSTAAVLGESSYLTHPPVEERLRISDALRLEAEAYFLGILDYFSRGIPRISALESAPDTRLPRLSYSVTDDGGLGIDPDGIVMEVGGDPVTPTYSSSSGAVTYRFPWDAANRDYDVALTARNLLGNTSPVFHDTVSIDLPVQNALFDNVPAYPGGVARVRARLVDVRGIPVREGTPVTVETSLGAGIIPTFVTDGRVDVPFLAPQSTQRVDVTLRAGGRAFESTIEVITPTGRDRSHVGDYRPVRVVDVRDGSPILNAVIARDGMPMFVPGANDGRYYVPRQRPPTAAPEWIVSAAGYITHYASGDKEGLPSDSIAMVPWFDGVLHGKRFMIDPEGGRARDVGTGPLGLAASEVNLRVAGYLAGFLLAAGAEARLTRTTEALSTPEDVARMTNRWGADRYIEIRHRAEPEDSILSVKTFHFPGSRTGRRFAADVGETLARFLGVPGRPATDLVTYQLQQTACPAIVVEAPTIAKIEEELRLDDPWYLRKQAYAMFIGIVDHYFAPEGGRVEVAVEGGGHWLVELSGTWHLLTDQDGRIGFEFVSPGRHRLQARRAEAVTREYFVEVGNDTTRALLRPVSARARDQAPE